jgi:ankyrin repeat protein
MLVLLVPILPVQAAAADTPLAEAVRASDILAVRALVRDGADVNASEPDGMTPLHWAAQLDALDTADVLIRAGASVAAATRYGMTPLFLACTNGSAPLVERLLEAGADPNSARPGGETALMTAARTGVLAAVDALLAHGADANAQEASQGQTALMWAAAENHLPVVQTLIGAGATVEFRSQGGLTPLLFAVRGGHLEVVRQLLSAGASSNDSVVPDDLVSTRDPNSALALAILNKRDDVALLLLEHGADANARDSRGSLLHLLAWVRRPGAYIQVSFVLPPINDAESLEVAASLLAHGADPNARIAWEDTPYTTDRTVRQPPDVLIGRNFLSLVGATPFYLAAKHSDVALMRLLVDHGADPLIPTEQHITPLIAAAGLGFWDGESPGPTTGVSEADTLAAVKLCVELGNDVNAATDFGDAELVSDGVTLLQRLPLHITRDPSQAIGDMRWGGSTALHGAAYRGLESVVRFLVDQGAQVDVKNRLGWTPLTVAGGFLVANNYHDPDARMIALLNELMTP